MQSRSGGLGGNQAIMPAPVVAWLVVAALLTGGVPIMTGVAVISDSTPAFTLDVCHPIGAVSYSLGQSAAPLIPAHPRPQAPAAVEFVRDFVPLFSPLPSRAPDPPPPKLSV
jgi:hypothetical protein